MLKIEASAGPIRQILAALERQDQRYLIDLMDIIEQESSAAAIDPEGLLTDANFEILAMIADNVEFADRQVSLLQMLPYSFTEIRNDLPIFRSMPKSRAS